MKKIIFSILNVIIFSVPLVAQQQRLPESLLPGNRVRVTAPQFFQKIKISKFSRKKSRLVGTVVAANADTLFFKVDNQPEPLIMSVPFASLNRLEVSRGKKSKIGSGAGVGFLIGAIAGAAIGYIADEEGNDLPPEHAALVVAGPGAILGILIGAGIGSRMRGDSWEEVPLNRALKANQN